MWFHCLEARKDLRMLSWDLKKCKRSLQLRNRKDDGKLLSHIGNVVLLFTSKKGSDYFSWDFENFKTPWQLRNGQQELEALAAFWRCGSTVWKKERIWGSFPERELKKSLNLIKRQKGLEALITFWKCSSTFCKQERVCGSFPEMLGIVRNYHYINHNGMVLLYIPDKCQFILWKNSSPCLPYCGDVAG